MSSYYVKPMTRDLPQEVRFVHWVLNSSEDDIWARIQREGITTDQFARECLGVADEAAIYGCDFQEVRKLRRWAEDLLEELGEGAGYEDLGAP